MKHCSRRRRQRDKRRSVVLRRRRRLARACKCLAPLPKVGRRLLLRAPSNWTMESPHWRGELLSLLSALRDATAKGRRVRIDLSGVERVYPAATVLFKAEIQCLNTQGADIKCVPPRSNRVCQVFKQVGLFDDLSYRIEIRVNRADVVHWATASGGNIDNNRVADALAGFAAKVPREDIERLLGGAGEALGNSVEHAYEFPRGTDYAHPSSLRWWAFASYRDRTFFLALCDLGCGIPVHLPKTHVHLHERLKASLQHGTLMTIPDSAYVAAAAMEGRSGTGLQNRGKGLPEMIREISTSAPRESGRRSGQAVHRSLRLFSNRALVRWESGTSRPTTFNFRDSIFGTILLWEVRLPPEKEPVL